MDADLSIAEQKLIDALEAARLESSDDDRPDGALTTAELARRMNCSIFRVRDWLGALKEKGKIEVVEVKAPDLCDRLMPKPAYRLVLGEDNDVESDIA